MKIYYARSINGGPSLDAIYTQTAEILRALGHTITDEFLFTTQTGQNSSMSPSEIYRRDVEAIRAADMVIADVTMPSVGVGYEVGLAEALGKPVLCLYWTDYIKRVSAMVAGNPNVALLEYTGLGDLQMRLKGGIASALEVLGHRKAQQIKLIKLRRGATLPTKAHETDAAFDLYAVESFVVMPGETHLTKLGIGIDLPQGYYAEIHSRSGLAVKHRIFIPNGPGIIDSGFQGEIGVLLANFNQTFTTGCGYCVQAGDRIAQMIIKRVEPVELAWADDFASKSARGKGGFGSTGGYGGNSTVIGLDLTT